MARPGSYTLQSINHHLYYVAPLSYNNLFINLAILPHPVLWLLMQKIPRHNLHYNWSGDSIAYLPGAILNQDLIRHI
jgi:hypothetical protein